MKNSQQIIELPVLCTIKNEEKTIDNNSHGIGGEERVCGIAGDTRFT